VARRPSAKRLNPTIVATVVKPLRVLYLLLGIGLPDETAHVPNEKLDLDNLHHGMLSAAYLLNELAETSPK
jgi:acetylornithine deacetylase/succinyl-diaminopimelate desuccinylase-like protein